ncbi:hypothetical protein Tco_0356033 [Tanacetum coccineum]
MAKPMIIILFTSSKFCISPLYERHGSHWSSFIPNDKLNSCMSSAKWDILCFMPHVLSTVHNSSGITNLLLAAPVPAGAARMQFQGKGIKKLRLNYVVFVYKRNSAMVTRVAFDSRVTSTSGSTVRLGENMMQRVLRCDMSSVHSWARSTRLERQVGLVYYGVELSRLMSLGVLGLFEDRDLRIKSTFAGDDTRCMQIRRQGSTGVSKLRYGDLKREGLYLIWIDYRHCSLEEELGDEAECEGTILLCSIGVRTQDTTHNIGSYSCCVGYGEVSKEFLDHALVAHNVAQSGEFLWSGRWVIGSTV